MNLYRAAPIAFTLVALIAQPAVAGGILDLFPEQQAETDRSILNQAAADLDEGYCPPSIAGKTWAAAPRKERIAWEACGSWAERHRMSKEDWVRETEGVARSYQLDQMEKVVKAKEREADLLRRLKSADDALRKR